VRGLPWPAWLDSGGNGRYDIVVAEPVVRIVTQGRRTEIHDLSGTRFSDDDPFHVVSGRLGEAVAPLPGIPFAGGALGYWGYDLARRYYRLPVIADDAEHLPEMAIGIYDWAIVIDHQEMRAQLVSRHRYEETARRLPEILERLTSCSCPATTSEKFRVRGPVEANLSRAEYKNAFDAVKRYLDEGDCYQVNLARRYSAQASGDAYSAYLELRRINPAPYSAFLDWPQAQILCASPERFLRVQGGRVETKPIKGTRARSADRDEDAKLAEDLRNHPKDRAENVMIVDLLRNDLGKACIPGSVRATKLFEIESFATVHHLVSVVEGNLKSGCDALGVLRACFPGGSITGAPKKRAMEIIEQLELHRRGVYCGAIGYAGYDGNMDTNIAIRTLVYSAGTIRCWAGGGVVADSRCETEYQETLDKAAPMLELLRRFGGTVVEG
jgi:para-aminobenzoate synthetase component 1